MPVGKSSGFLLGMGTGCSRQKAFLCLDLRLRNKESCGGGGSFTRVRKQGVPPKSAYSVPWAQGQRVRGATAAGVLKS